MLRNLWLFGSGLAVLTQGEDPAGFLFGAMLSGLGLALLQLRLEHFWENSQND